LPEQREAHGMSCRNLVLILGDQLNHDNSALEAFDAAQDRVLMVEAAGEAAHVWSHKARIALFLAAMRHFAAGLAETGIAPIYLQLGRHDFPTLQAAWQAQIAELQPQRIVVCEPGEYRILQLINNCAAQAGIALAVRDDTHFMCSRADFARWAGKDRHLRMEFFYRFMRKQYGVLMHSGKPAGDAWNFDRENRKSFGRQGPQGLPPPLVFERDALTREALEDVERHFPQHPGSLADFNWPVTRAQALQALDRFISLKLAEFGPHQDAMWQGKPGDEMPFLWHSHLSSSLNLKLLDPREVIAAAEKAWRERGLPLASVEGFIRQIMGWREFIRGVYWLEMPAMGEANHYGHHRQLPAWYWTGKTHMNCMRQTIGQTLRYGYAHHIQRLMITGQFGLLAEIDPRQVEAWYLAVYVDAVEWVEMPNTGGMALHASGGRFTTKPYVASGAYIKRMSNYCAGCRYKPEVKTGPQACPFTTLYWNFLFKHRDSFAANPRTMLMAKNAERFTAEEQAAVQSQAANMLDRLDHL
jgi:deoxyribodipyrimidine photolyase-related protein